MIERSLNAQEKERRNSGNIKYAEAMPLQPIVHITVCITLGAKWVFYSVFAFLTATREVARFLVVNFVFLRFWRSIIFNFLSIFQFKRSLVNSAVSSTLFNIYTIQHAVGPLKHTYVIQLVRTYTVYTNFQSSVEWSSLDFVQKWILLDNNGKWNTIHFDRGCCSSAPLCNTQWRRMKSEFSLSIHAG